jgi:orotate phosphoribosyltransferase
MNTTREWIEGTGALLVPTDRHFVYKSRRHGGVYVNKDLVYTHPLVLDMLGKTIAAEVAHMGAEVIIGPAVGAAILVQAVGYYIATESDGRVRCAYAEKEMKKVEDPTGQGRKLFQETGAFVFNRGYEDVVRGREVVVVEDIVTTGGSVGSVVKLARSLDCTVLAVRAIWNRGGDKVREKVGVEDFDALVKDTFPDYDVKDPCPFCEQGIPIDTKIGHGGAYVAEFGQPQKKQ